MMELVQEALSGEHTDNFKRDDHKCDWWARNVEMIEVESNDHQATQKESMIGWQDRLLEQILYVLLVVAS